MGKKGFTFKLFVTMTVTLTIISWMGIASSYAAEASSAIPSVIEKTTPSVVAIIGRPTGSDKTWEKNRFNLAHGTGVIVQSDGLIITNAHVVKDMQNIVVVTYDGKSYNGKTTNIDEESDLALVKIEASGLKAATLAASGDLEVGETVAAIGTPISFALRNSVTVGIVSGIDRSVNSGYQLIQTDAAINPGNSGGALVNMKGEVVGINTLKYAELGVESLGFAIPMDTVKYVLQHFKSYGKVKRPYLGLELEESWEAVVGLPTSEALRVAYVDPDSPGAKGGIKQDDLFLSIGSSSVRTLVDYNEALKKYLPGETVDITLSSGGSKVTKQVILGEAQSSGNTLTQDKGGTSLDADRGKTRIGDSHFGWTLKYPAGLVKQFQTDTGDSVSFADAKGEFGLMIKVDDKGSGDISPAKLLGLLSGDDSQGPETILERQYIKQKDQSYAKIIAKSGTSYIQGRAFLHDHKIYYLTLYVKDEEHYKNDFKQKSYNDLLDSFQLSFDSKDEALKDISVYSDANTTFTNGYGLSLDLPSDWKKSDYKGSSGFYNKDYTQGVNVLVTSASSGDTLQDWVDRDIHQLETIYLEKYREVSMPQESTLAGVPAIEIDYSTTMGNKWSSGHVIYLIKDKYKYQIRISYEKEGAKPEELKKLIDTVTSSLVINKEQMDSKLGFIQDIDELQDPNGTITFQNEKYKYKLQIPEIWSNSTYGKDKDQAFTTFDFTGGDLSIQADTEKSYDDTVKNEDTDQKKSSENDAKYKYTASDESIFGSTGRKYVVSYSTNKVPYQETTHIFRLNNITYTVILRINEAVRSEVNEARLNKAFESLSFLK